MEQTTNSKAKNILMGLSSDKRVKKLLNQFQHITNEIKKKNTEITAKIDKNTQDRVARAMETYHGAVKNFQHLEAKIESEIEKTLEKVKDSTHELEMNLKLYKGKALQQVKDFQGLKKAKSSQKKTKKASTPVSTTKKSKAKSNRSQNSSVKTKTKTKPKMMVAKKSRSTKKVQSI